MSEADPRDGVRPRYLKQAGTGVITGVQALVRLALVQAERDRRAGLRTGGFVSGYRGSPLGTLDSAFARVGDLVSASGIVVQPAVNEELAATAIGGTQHIAMTEGAKVDGVFALWYGKGPGVDRAADALRHGNYAGSSRLGGVVVAVGDDHAGKSSSLVVNSNGVCASLNLPLFFPADPGEVLSLGVHAYAASRLSGSWIGLKILPEIADSAQTVEFGDVDMPVVLPAVNQPADGLHIRWPDTLLEQEHRQHRYRLAAVQSYVRANRLDRRMTGEAGARIGIVASGKSWRDLVEALDMLGLDEGKSRRCGVSCYKLAMIWPVEPERLREFAQGLDTLVVVEEKGPFVETQLRSLLYGVEGAPRRIERISVGGQGHLPDDGVLTPDNIALQLGAVFTDLGEPEIDRRLADIRRQVPQQGQAAAPVIRKAHFCSGCPHNTSTSLPAGSRASGGIGCHSMAVWIADNTAVWAQMGGEGVQWTGLSHFTAERHVFANMGDGTYFHSGILAIRQAVAAGTTMTYKILFNDAVAMTGGQKVDGELTVPRLIQQLRAEGVGTIRVVTDDPAKYQSPQFRVDVPIDSRDELDRVQREMREVPGVSVLVYDQMCATELRRGRKRGTLPDPQRRAFINEAVCEACGDCSAKSNCLSVEPVRTEFGTKRRINQSTCNKDMSCLRGFCPSFVTVEGGTLRKSAAADLTELLSEPLPDPVVQVSADHTRIVVAGIGGTGVVTIGALLAAAGEASGRVVAVLDDVGMAQKGGAVQSSIQIAARADSIKALKIPAKRADLILACDQIVANGKDVLEAVAPARTRVVSNGNVAITGDFIRSRAVADPSLLHLRLERQAGPGMVDRLPFTALAEQLLGDGIGSNLMMVGFALQKGLIPVDPEAIERAIELNGTAVSMNRRAFQVGRLLASAPERVLALVHTASPEPQGLEEIKAHRAAWLTRYQDGRYARRYLAAVERVQEAERRVVGSDELSIAAARSLAQIMAYKDEYEVARLFVDTDFVAGVRKQFDGPIRLRFHLAPPLLARRDPVTGHLRKRSYGGWVLPAFRLLAAMRRLRGTWADPFGYTAERRTERRLVAEFEKTLDAVAMKLTPDNHALALEIVEMAMSVRGYGHIKDAATECYEARRSELMERYLRPSPIAAAKSLSAAPLE